MVRDVLTESGLPLAYPTEAPFELPPDRGYDDVVRVSVRSLTVMQKEAIVASSQSPHVWRVTSDEGPYLAGHDISPAPLAVTTAGIAADIMDQVEAVAGAKTDAQVTVDTYFRIEGSMIRGTMTGIALPPTVAVSVPTMERDRLQQLALTAVNASATIGLLGPAHASRFALSSNGRPIDVGEVAAMDESTQPDAPSDESPRPIRSVQPVITKIRDVGLKTVDAEVGLDESQDRPLHIRAEGRWRQDGVKEIAVDVIKPVGSMFQILSDASGVAAPDARSLLSAGLGFCFMTQIGRFAKIVREDLGAYSIVQDTRFSVGDPAIDPPIGGRAAAPDTFVYLNPTGDDDFARRALAMSEQTCFLHALCRTELRPKVRVVAGVA